MKLSVAMATFNEERNIEACLNSIKGWADEIILVDGGSTDKTVEIAQRYGAKVTITNNPSIFHINKQKAIEKASGDWILQLDADERITPELKEEVKEILTNDQRQTTKDQRPTVGYWIPRKNFFLRKWMKKGGLYPDSVIRLFKKGKGKFPYSSVHEQIEINGSIGTLRNPLIHYAFPDYNAYLRKFETYSNLRKEEIKKTVTKPTIWNNIKFLCIKPLMIFLNIFISNKGFEDGLPGFIYAISSSYQEMIAYGKFWTEFNHARQQK